MVVEGRSRSPAATPAAKAAAAKAKASANASASTASSTPSAAHTVAAPGTPVGQLLGGKVYEVSDAVEPGAGGPTATEVNDVGGTAAAGAGSSASASREQQATGQQNQPQQQLLQQQHQQQQQQQQLAYKQQHQALEGELMHALAMGQSPVAGPQGQQAWMQQLQQMAALDAQLLLQGQAQPGQPGLLAQQGAPQQPQLGSQPQPQPQQPQQPQLQPAPSPGQEQQQQQRAGRPDLSPQEWEQMHTAHYERASKHEAVLERQQL